MDQAEQREREQDRAGQPEHERGGDERARVCAAVEASTAGRRGAAERSSARAPPVDVGELREHLARAGRMPRPERPSLLASGDRTAEDHEVRIERKLAHLLGAALAA